ncbi:MAG: hypothetical protein GKC10_07935 [Methanosarcinales archaeon]|nr:hypothetical protein [Methanosarcinales archaeon]
MEVVFRPEPTELQMSGVAAAEGMPSMPATPGQEGRVTVGYLPEPQPLIALQERVEVPAIKGALPVPESLDRLGKAAVQDIGGAPAPRPSSELG